MKCPSCNTECLEGSNFCHMCGQSLNSFSNSINHIPARDIFSNSDSTIAQALKRLMPTSYVEKLLASDGRSDGERRIVTILFSDVKGSTSLGESLDPEEVLFIMNGAFDILIKPIMKYEGTLARLMGDAILAFFGAPIAHEDDPQRACRAALEIIEGAKKFSKKLEEEKGIKGFDVRVGINTGLVVVAEVGADLRVEYTAMGDAVNVASRMESAAEPGSILITEETKKLLPSTFMTKDLGPILVKGKTRPINSFRLLSEKTADSMALDYFEHHSPLIGRELYIKDILDSFHRAERGEGKVVSIVGECGIGKTRLLNEVKSLTSDTFYWIEVKSLAYRHNNSYWLIKELLNQYLIKENDFTTEEGLLVKLREKIKLSSNKKFADIFPFLCYLLDLHTETELSLQLNFNDAEGLKGQIHYAVKEFIKDQQPNKPLVLSLEDLQWCDSASVELIEELFSLVNKNEMVILLTFRKNDRMIWKVHENNLNASVNYYHSFLLSPLSEQDGKRFIRNIDENSFISEKMMTEILKRTGGNPLFIEEVIKSLFEKRISRSENEIQIDYDEVLEIPNLLQSVIMARLDRLSSVDKLVLQSAAVIGRIFQKKLLEEVLSNSLKEKEIDNSLENLKKKEFIIQHNSVLNKIGNSNYDSEFIFKQSLIQEVAYTTLLKSSRQKIHLNVGDAIEKLYPEIKEEIADSLAVHFEKGNSPEKSINYYKIAADRAKSISANKEAKHFYQKSLLLSKDIIISKRVLAQIYESLGDVSFIISDYKSSIESYHEALKIVESPENQTCLHQKCAKVYEHWGQYDNSIEFYNISLEIIKDKKNSLLEAQSYIGIGMVYYRQGLLDEAKKFSTNALELLKYSQNSLEISETFNNLGIIYSKLNKLDEALEYHLESLEIRKNLGDASGLAASYNNLGYVCQLQNNYKDAIEYYKSSIEFCEKIGNLHGLAKIYDNLSQIYIKEGNSETAMNYNLKAMEILGRIAIHSSDINQHVWLQAGVW